MPGCGSGRRSEEAETGKLGSNEGLAVAVDHAGLSACGGIHGVAESVEQASLRDRQADATAALGISSNAASNQTIYCDGACFGTGSPIVRLEALSLCHCLHDKQNGQIIPYMMSSFQPT